MPPVIQVPTNIFEYLKRRKVPNSKIRGTKLSKISTSHDTIQDSEIQYGRSSMLPAMAIFSGRGTEEIYAKDMKLYEMSTKLCHPSPSWKKSSIHELFSRWLCPGEFLPRSISPFCPHVDPTLMSSCYCMRG